MKFRPTKTFINFAFRPNRARLHTTTVSKIERQYNSIANYYYLSESQLSNSFFFSFGDVVFAPLLCLWATPFAFNGEKYNSDLEIWFIIFFSQHFATQFTHTCKRACYSSCSSSGNGRRNDHKRVPLVRHAIKAFSPCVLILDLKKKFAPSIPIRIFLLLLHVGNDLIAFGMARVKNNWIRNRCKSRHRRKFKR